MKYLIIIFLCHAIFQHAACQPGFSTIYDLDRPAVEFLNIAKAGDTLLLYGVTIDDAINQQVLLFAQMDTNCNLLSFHTVYDSLGNTYFGEDHAPILKLQNNSGYMTLGSVRNNGMILFIDNLGNFTKVTEYPDATSLTDWYLGISTVPGGYMVFGHKQKTDYNEDVFVMKIDKSGHKLWEKSYDSPNQQYYYDSHYVIDDNTFLISISKRQWGDPPASSWTFQGVFLAIDSLGNEKWRWEGPESFEETGAYDLQKTPEGNWMYITQKLVLYSGNSFRLKGKVVVRDSNFNLIWEKLFLPDNVNDGYFRNLQTTVDGNWIASGTRLRPTNPGFYNAYLGWSVKFDGNGTEIWSRADTVFYSASYWVEHRLVGAVQLPSGSTIACGIVKKYDTGKSWGWLLKISQDGCVDTLNCISLSTTEKPFEEFNATRVYPNPTNSVIHISSPDQEAWDSIELLDYTGQQLPFNISPQESEVDMRALPTGFYFIRFNKAGVVMTKKVVKI